MKTERELQDRCYRLARGLLLAVLAFIGIVSLWTPLLNPEIAERWFTWPNIAWLSPVPVVTALVAFAHWRALDSGARSCRSSCRSRCSSCRSSGSGSACGRT